MFILFPVDTGCTTVFLGRRDLANRTALEGRPTTPTRRPSVDQWISTNSFVLINAHSKSRRPSMVESAAARCLIARAVSCAVGGRLTVLNQAVLTNGSRCSSAPD